MTPEQQRKADHLALVAAPLLAAFHFGELDSDKVGTRMLCEDALDYAEVLQKAAEERVKE